MRLESVYKAVIQIKKFKMKKRINFTLRTTIYLAILGLVTLTGVFYAANPSPRDTVSKSVAEPAAPLANPTPFSTAVPLPIGVAADPNHLFVTEYANGNVDLIDCDGNF